MKTCFLTLCTAFALCFPMLTACSSDTPEPTPKHKDDTHAPTRIVLTLSAGHFHGVKFHGDGILALTNEHITKPEEPRFFKSVQRITLNRVDGRWQVAQGSDSVFRVLAAGRYTTPYGLWITYIAADGDTLNSSFGGNLKAINAHQHFFTAQNLGVTADGDLKQVVNNTDSLFTYTYMDTNPWHEAINKTASNLVGSTFVREGVFEAKNPLGLKGFFTFTQPRTRFDIRVRLKHFEGATKFVGGKPYAFNKPVAAAADEVDFTFPVIVFASRNETDDFETTYEVDWATRQVTNYNEATDAEKRFIESLRAAYGCTLEEILWDVFLRYENGLQHDSPWWF